MPDDPDILDKLAARERPDAAERFKVALKSILSLPPERASEIRAEVRPGSTPADGSGRSRRRRSGAGRRPGTAPA